MLINTASILLLFFLFAGAGSLLSRIIFKRDPTFLVNFWVGWCLTIAFLQIWHFFYRIDGFVLGLFFGFSAIGWILKRASIMNAIRDWRQPRFFVTIGLALGLALILGNHVITDAPNVDHGLYHQATVQWSSEYAIVPGLGNLHHRLAFNNANMLYASMINSGLLKGLSIYLSNTLLIYVLIVQCAAGAYRFFKRGSTHQTTHLFYALMGPAVLLYGASTNLIGYSPDVVVFVLQTVLAGEFLRLLEMRHEHVNTSTQSVIIVLIAATGIAVKLSFIGFGLTFLMALFVFWLTNHFSTSSSGRMRILLIGLEYSRCW
jgi:hypothetical protein